MRVLVSLLVLTCLSPTAFADPWGDAKRQFRRELKSEDWKVRREAYGRLAFFDGTLAVEEVVDAMGQEENAAVVLQAIKVLGAFISEEAHAELAAQMLGAKGHERLYLAMALGMQKGDVGKDALLQMLGDKKDEQGAAQAALALGRKQASGAIEALLPFLRHDEWQLRLAAARGIHDYLGPPPEKPTDPKKKAGPWLPEGFDEKGVTKALVEALEAAEGMDRGGILGALQRITKLDLGYDVGAWKAYAGGTAPEKLRRKPVHPPYFFQQPVWGRKVVILTTTNVRSEKPAPFDRDRMQVLCEVPGGRSLVWFKIKTTRQFMDAWYRRTMSDMVEVGDMKLDFIVAATTIDSAFGRLTSATPSTENKLEKYLEKLKADSGNDTLTAVMEALDISGSKDKSAWTKGPDQILFSTCAIPWLADEVDQEVIAAAIGLKAARRMVTITAVGVDEHPYSLCKTVADLSGGTYTSLER